MKDRPICINGFHKTDSGPLWKWKKISLTKPEEKLADFFHDGRKKVEEAVLGPGAGAGIGCGVGVGIGIVGGAGFDGWLWNHLKLVAGIGMGCGVGVGFGYGQGFGVGSSLGSLRYHLFERKSKSGKRVVVQI